MAMKPKEAQRIFNEYDAVVNSKKKEYEHIFSETLRPYPEATIEEAIKVLAISLKAANKLNGEILERLKAAYISLGVFISQEEADFIRSYKATLSTAVNAGFAGQTKKYQFITNKVRNQEDDRTQAARTFFFRLLHDKPL